MLIHFTLFFFFFFFLFWALLNKTRALKLLKCFIDQILVCERRSVLWRFSLAPRFNEANIHLDIHLVTFLNLVQRTVYGFVLFCIVFDRGLFLTFFFFGCSLLPKACSVIAHPQATCTRQTANCFQQLHPLLKRS